MEKKYKHAMSFHLDCQSDCIMSGLKLNPLQYSNGLAGNGAIDPVGAGHQTAVQLWHAVRLMPE